MNRPTWNHLVAGLAALVMIFFAFVLGRDVPLLGLVDLGFHELGHLLTAPFGKTLSFAMGSGTQVLVPAGLAVYFAIRGRDALASALMLVWMGTSMQDVSVYIGDGPHQLLPLIGGEHDWAYLLGRWEMMDRADDLAGMVWTLGLIAAIWGSGWIAHLGWRSWRRGENPSGVDPEPLVVREPRPPL